MSGNLNASSTKAAQLTNMQRAAAAWGSDMPAWVRLLASACDTTSQGQVAGRLGKSGPYVSRVLRNNYTGDMAEAEQLVRVAYGREDVVCPMWGTPIPLSSCVRTRRRSERPQGQVFAQLQRLCATCPNNTDLARPDGADDEEDS